MTRPFKNERSLKWQLTILSLSLVAPTLLFVGVLLWQFSAAERSRVEEEARGLSRGFAVAVDREINGVLTTLQALATSPSLRSRDFAGFYDQAREVSRLQGINISLRDLNGRAILTTRAPLGADVRVPAVLAEMDKRVLRSGTAMVSDVFTSTVAGRRVFQIIAAPVSVAGSPTYFLSASIEADYLAEAIRREHLPPGWIGGLVDRNGMFVARTEHHEDLVGQPASPDFRSHVGEDEGIYYGHNSVGSEVLVGFAKSALSGWTAAASLTTDAVNAPLRRSLAALLGLGFCLGLVATCSAWLAGRRLSMAFDHIKTAVTAIGHEQTVAPVVTRIAEINQVGLALQTAARKLTEKSRERDEAAAALRDLNETLEKRVDARTRERNRLWETTNDLVGAGSFHGELKAVNPAWTALLGWSEAELLARPFIDLVDPSDHASLADVVAKLSAGESVTGYVDRVTTKSGRFRTIMWSAVPVREENVFYMVGRDLTEQREAEDALRQSQKMEALGKLTGGIAHDFNNMLAVIMGALNVLQRRLARGDVHVTKYIDGALEGATRAATLTHRLLRSPASSRSRP